MKYLLFTLIALTSQAFAQGSETGNGGGIHFCPGRSQQELYDIYEGRTRHDLEIREGDVPTTDILPNAVKKISTINPTLALEVEKQIAYLSDKKNFLKRDNLQLNIVPDADILAVNKGCEYRQLANWDNMTNKVLVDNDYYSSLPEYHQEALKLHEALYKVVRDRLKVTNSNEVRQFVAQLLSTSPMPIDPYTGVSHKFKKAWDVLALKRDLGPSARLVLNQRTVNGDKLQIAAHFGDVKFLRGDERVVRVRLVNVPKGSKMWMHGCKAKSTIETYCTISQYHSELSLNDIDPMYTLELSVMEGDKVLYSKTFGHKATAWATWAKINFDYTQNAWK